MAMSAAVPAGGITLHGVSNEGSGLKKGAASALLLELSDSQVQDFRKAAQVKDGLQLVTGTMPKLRVGGRTIDLSLAPDAFRNELYASTVAGSLADLTFAGLVSHRAELKSHDDKLRDERAGSDVAALAALKSSLASIEQEKQANHTNIVNAVLPTPKTRFEAAKKSRRSILGTDLGGAALAGGSAPRAQTSNPLNETEVRSRALRTPVLHLLAIAPTSASHIVQKTHIPKDDIEKILPKIARQGEDGTWKLIDRAYKDLDVWSFGYTMEKNRQSAIDNAVRAFDRQRIGKEEKIWQQLLPKEDRGKGLVLSRLGVNQGQRGLTPMHASSPMPGESDSKGVSAVNTPRVGASTPRLASSKGDVMKRLLSKDPKKRAEVAVKEQKRKERAAAREAAASERKAARAGKKQTAKKENPKIKSAEIVHSSDDESGEEGELKDEITRVDSRISLDKSRSGAEAQRSSGSSTSPNSSDGASNARKTPVKNAAKARANPDPARSIASLASKSAKPAAAAGKVTPRTTNGLSAPNSQHKIQRSPQKASRPNVPSPLGAARPRLASDVSDRTAVGMQRNKQGALTPVGLGITNGTGRKRHDTVTSSASSESDKKHSEDVSTKKKLAASSSANTRAPLTNGVARKAEGGVKRKAEEPPSQAAQKPAKHRKTDTSPPHYDHNSHMPQTSTARTSPDTTSSSSENSVLETITFTQGISVAEKFMVYYPAYAKMHDDLAAKQAKGDLVSAEERERLWAMHRRLEQMKREIAVASRREHGEE